MPDSSLGENTNYPTGYDPSILVGLNRADSRQKLRLDSNNYEIFGIDSWTCYELSWLNENGIPRNSILYFSYSCHSKFFVESKSLKLYLYSLNNKKFFSNEELIQTIKGDLEAALKTAISLEVSTEPREIISNQNCIDSLNIEAPSAQPNSLVLLSNDKDVDEDVSCGLFRSLCPVTAQPDWATVYIAYKGKQIKHESLLSYLLSYRNHQGFHEECVERIFQDLNERCELESLLVRANYLRRGGIEINPVRTTQENFEQILREQRQ
ncbi:MAG: NADPH-dependent 7-cyano-7-deazaguanine reductase QueF [SAR86 cluster bacterium]|jgi:7-cyano-7-deazaguanine reductase|nr:NADPH-dependent 7-cyano-7-deazaguanine reductase QueF [SAR86 cluster bacterium]|tara:strand:+ start:2870 stop:3667 length:798 start_codon:yes stop_codon:yes gene_type:complete